MNPAPIFFANPDGIAEPDEAPARDAGAAPAIFVVGDYTVGDSEDELLNGHPDIRY